MQTIIATVAVVVAALGPLLVIIGTLVTTIGNLMIFGPIIIATLGAIAAPVAIVVGVIAGLIAIGIALYKNWDTIKAKAQALGKGLQAAWNFIKTNAIGAWNAVRNGIAGAWNKISSTVSGKVNALKGKLSGAWSAIKSAAASAWNAVKEHIVNPIKAAGDKVKGVIDKIKGFFPIKIGNILSGLRLPHFSISGKFGINPPSVPKFSVSWYKTGGIFDAPTIAGIGEAGPEAVVPLNEFWNKLDRIAAAAEANPGSVVINVYPSQGMDEQKLAEKIDRILTRRQKQRSMAW
jgi:phage-related minor tail protein